MEGGDLQVKYQKIAAEYSKLRAQASVLKKAVVEEQGRNAEFRDVLREREQSLRKATQEMESLTFRNQQLTKRVTVLQDELEAHEARPKKGKVKAAESNYGSDSNSVIGEELQMKIEENVRLVTVIHDNEVSYQQQIATLNQRVESLEFELHKGNRENSETEKKYRLLISKLENDKTFLLKGLGASPDSLSDIVPFVESSEHSNEANSLQVMTRAGSHIKELAAAFSAYHLLTEQRIHCSPMSLSPASSKFSSYLKESGLLVQDIQVQYAELQACMERSNNTLTTDTLPSLQSFSEKLTAYTNYLHKLIPYHQLSLEEESSNDGRLVTMNNELELQLKGITNQFFKLNSYVKLLSVQGKRSQHQSCSSQRRFLSELTDVVKALLEAMKGLALAHVAKNSLQVELANSSEWLKATDQRLIKAVDSMVASTEKLLKILLDCRILLEASGAPTNGSNSSAFNDSEFEDVVDADESGDSAPMISLGQMGSREALLKQLENCRVKATKLEQDKEHWHLEFKLLRLKHSKRTKELEEQLLNVKNPAMVAKGEKTQEDSAYSATTVTNLLGRLDAPFALTVEMEAREQEVKNYLTKRIDHLVAMRQMEETKAITLTTECAVLQRRLELSTTSKLQADTRLRELQERSSRLQEELHTTTHNYETQLSMMSEHLANMNDKLTVQRDEIDQLKYQLANPKSSRKGKQK